MMSHPWENGGRIHDHLMMKVLWEMRHDFESMMTLYMIILLMMTDHH